MDYEIYIDVFAVTNFGMDLLALFLTNVFLGRERRIRTLIFPSLLGSVAGVLLFFLLNDYGVYSILIHFLVNPCMVWLAYRETSKRQFLEDWGVTYLVVLLAGGIMQWIYHTLFHGRFQMAAMGLTVFIGLIAAAFWHYRNAVGARIYEVRLCLGAETVTLRAYYDTGNLLIDPYVKRPVSIVSSDVSESLLLREKGRGRLIPYASLGENHGLIEVYTLEKMLIYKGKRVIAVEPAVIGVTGKQLFAQGEYQMILNSRLL